jgi:hypothetical protein
MEIIPLITEKSADDRRTVCEPPKYVKTKLKHNENSCNELQIAEHVNSADNHGS